MNFKRLFKQLTCEHSILTTTKVISEEPLFIVSSLIQCEKCEKSFPYLPGRPCCYVQHIHSEIMKDKFAVSLMKMRQQQNSNRKERSK